MENADRATTAITNAATETSTARTRRGIARSFPSRPGALARVRSHRSVRMLHPRAAVVVRENRVFLGAPWHGLVGQISQLVTGIPELFQNFIKRVSLRTGRRHANGNESDVEEVILGLAPH